MTVVAITAAKIEPIDPLKAEIFAFLAVEAITKGQAVYQSATGEFGVADANDSGKQQFRGIALNGAAAGGAVDVLKRGRCAGFTVSGLSADAILYLSDTAGSLDTAVGTMTVNAGRVVAMSDASLTFVVYVDANWNRVWA